MIGLVLVTHGNLADELVNAMEHVVGPQEKVSVICIDPEDDMELRRVDILNAITDVSAEDGAVVMTDMFGGTPSNLAISIMDQVKVEVIAGVNLPMLVKFASCRDSSDLTECVVMSQDAGRKYINVASQLMLKTKGID